MKLKLQENYSDFINYFSHFENEAKEIIINYKDNSEKLKSERENWENKIIDYVKKSINPEPKKLLERFKNSQNEQLEMNYQIGFNTVKSKVERDIYRKNQLRFKIKELSKLKGYLSITDSLKGTDENVILELNSIKDKLDYILEKLFIVYGDEFYSIGTILELNNIEFRDGETLEICENLDKKGYIIREKQYSDKDLAKISIKGAEYIERKKKASSIKSKKKGEESVNTKIDVLLKKLEELGYGQEIIFNEIDELRDLSKKLSKKSWSQLIKGKVVDLAISNLIDKNIATFIYESLVNDKFKLLR